MQNHHRTVTSGPLVVGERAEGYGEGPWYRTPWSGTYAGLLPDEWSEEGDKPMHLFRDGIIGDIPQTMFAFPVESTIIATPSEVAMSLPIEPTEILEIHVGPEDLIADYLPDSSGRYRIYHSGDYLVTEINGGSGAGGEEFAEILTRAPEHDPLPAEQTDPENSWEPYMLTERFGSCDDIGPVSVKLIDGKAYLADWAEGVSALSVTSPAPTDADVVAAIAQAKREILDDIRDGRVPASVADFSSLHDYVDANEYGGLCAGYIDWIGPDGDHLEWSIRVQDAVHEWLAAGRPGKV